MKMKTQIAQISFKDAFFPDREEVASWKNSDTFLYTKQSKKQLLNRWKKTHLAAYRERQLYRLLGYFCDTKSQIRPPHNSVAKSQYLSMQIISVPLQRVHITSVTRIRWSTARSYRESNILTCWEGGLFWWQRQLPCLLPNVTHQPTSERKKTPQGLTYDYNWKRTLAY